MGQFLNLAEAVMRGEAIDEGTLARIYEAVGDRRAALAVLVADKACARMPPDLVQLRDFVMMSPEDYDAIEEACLDFLVPVADAWGNLAFRLFGRRHLSLSADALACQLTLAIGPAKDANALRIAIGKALSRLLASHVLASQSAIGAVISGLSRSHLHRVE